MANYDMIAQQIGGPLWLFVIIVVWTMVWKLLALWKAARNKDVAWFVVMGILNTIGILPILYIYIFSKWTKKKPMKEIKVVKKKTPKKKSSKKKK
ncbi:MAG: hypothetical protein KC516_01385 [Nanoarchaeota archaeon]|nr:hypothetical protein [Nanoarchaeota archaeon]